MRLPPGEQEVFSERHAGGRMAAGEFDDAVGGHFEIGAHDDGTGEAGVEASAEVGRQSRLPLARGSEQQHLFGVDLARAVAVITAAARQASLAAKGIFHLDHPGLGHECEDLLPRLRAGGRILRDEVREDGLRAKIVDALRGGGLRLVLDLARKPADNLEGGFGLGLHQVGEGAAQHRGRDLREHAEHLAGGLTLLPVVDLLLGTEDGHVVIPDARDLVALGEFSGLFGGQKGGDLLAEAFVGDLVQLGPIREVSLGEVPEASGEQHAARGKATGGILAAQFLGAAGHPLGDPETFVG